MLVKAAVAAWLNRYIDAWRSYDPQAIGDLFTEGATYRNTSPGASRWRAARL